jgi:lipopolysaccharide/colanic/teichoic acid biosynthesis glycosyltransferase
MAKRLCDILFSLFGLIVFSLLLIVIAIWIKLDSKGPVFYRGKRVGLNGKPFLIYKFRSMVTDAEAKGGPSTSDSDSRITKAGRFVRKFKLDELSQFINVLIGDMSFVGPRPEVQMYVDQYTEEEKAILTVRPGITDWATIWNSDEGAVLAKHDDPDKAYEELIRPTKLKLQLYYVRNRTLLMDLKLVVYTVLRVVKRSFYPNELAAYPKLLTDDE